MLIPNYKPQFERGRTSEKQMIAMFYFLISTSFIYIRFTHTFKNLNFKIIANYVIIVDVVIKFSIIYIK